MPGIVKSLRPARKPETAEAFRQFGMQPTAAEVTGRRGIEATEKTLSKIPFVGLRGVFRKQVRDLSKQTSNFVNKLQNSVSKSADDIPTIGDDLAVSRARVLEKVSRIENKMYSRFLTKADKGGTFELDKVKTAVKQISERRAAEPLKAETGEAFRGWMEQLSNLPRMSASQVHRSRKLIDDSIRQLQKKASVGQALREEITDLKFNKKIFRRSTARNRFQNRLSSSLSKS